MLDQTPNEERRKKMKPTRMRGLGRERQMDKGGDMMVVGRGKEEGRRRDELQLQVTAFSRRTPIYSSAEGCCLFLWSRA